MSLKSDQLELGLVYFGKSNLIRMPPPPLAKNCVQFNDNQKKHDGGFLLGRISIYNLMSTLTTNVEVVK